MARTTVIDNASIPTAGTQVMFRVSAGPIGVLVNYIEKDSPDISTDLTIEFEVSYLDTPVVGTDAHWYKPSTAVGVADNLLTIASAGRWSIDLSSKSLGGTAGVVQFNQIPTGVNWLRVTCKGVGGTTGPTTVIVLHNPESPRSQATI